MGILRVILGDQLDFNISSLIDCDKKQDTLLMCEVWNEATYVKHHKKKIAFLFSAMRHFCEELKSQNYNVHYTKLDDEHNTQSFSEEIKRCLKSKKFKKVVVTFPGEYRVLNELQKLKTEISIPLEIREDSRFLSTLQEFKDWAKDRKELRMEFFYREMRKKHNILMKEGKPIGGKWNYDSENRKTPKSDLNIPKTYQGKTDKITQNVINLVAKKFSNHFGDLEPFSFAVNRKQALYALKKFIEERLANFGNYQDAMIENEPWMYHSHLSFYINCGLLNPKECIQAAEEAYHKNKAPLNAAEGFIRQILGWREFVRGLYWLHIPGYAKENFFNAKRKLPDFFWTAQTQMNCLKQCITETKQNAYAHHIQRLMVIGNFCLLAGLDPQEVNTWYLIVYADAFEWVEMPNVTGMILFADGGLLASKPYAASGAYINRMSNYCKNCTFNVKEKNGENACPFNYLYWNFLIENKSQLANNPRLGMPYRTIKNMNPEKIKTIQKDSQNFLNTL